MSNVELDDEGLTHLMYGLDGDIAKDVLRRAENVERFQRALLSLPGTGRMYVTRFYTDRLGRIRPGGPRPPHRASAPGLPPSLDTGLLKASIGLRLGVDSQGVYAQVGSGAGARPAVQYAIYLEYGVRWRARSGTRRSSSWFIEPRPFLRPSLDAVKL